MKSTSTLAILFAFIFLQNASAQVKVVIMGSSTAYGVGASSYENSWAGKTEAYYNQDATDGRDTIFYNIAQPGYDTYQEMPSDFIPPAGRPLPDDDYNVTKALSYNPDVVIINLPSNDINYGYAKSEMISNLRYMSDRILATGFSKCYITTPQPRNDMDADHRDSLLALVDSVNYSFGPFAINFWDGLVTTDGQNMLKDEYRAIPSPLHVNDAGHNLLFERVRDKSIFGIGGPVALQLTNFRAVVQNSIVKLSWHTEQQAANTGFELQRSQDGYSFETISNQYINDARLSSDYSGKDETPFTGKNFYRLKITEAARTSFSNTIAATSPGKTLSISTLFTDNGSSRLVAVINIQKSQFVNIMIVSSSGAVVSKQKEFINQPGNTVNIPIGSLAAGQYYIRVFTNDGNAITNSFKK